MQNINLILGDCLEKLNNIEDKSIDMILCDLPYGTTQNKWDTIIPLNDYILIDNKIMYIQEYLLFQYKNGVEYKKAIKIFEENKQFGLWHFYEKILKDNGVIVLTSAGKFTNTLIESKIDWFKYKIIWEKSKATNFLNCKKQPLRKYEEICIFYKKQCTYNPQMTLGEIYNKGIRKDVLTGSYGKFSPVEVKSNGERYPKDIIYFKTAETEGTVYHPTQKPIELARYLIRTYSNKNDVILDNAFGSGSFLIAGILEHRNVIGIEKDEKYFKIAKNRINKIDNI